MARRRGGDKLFKKEKEKKDFRRKKDDKELIKSIIIACEDSVSFPTYFKMIIDRLILKKKITQNSVVIVPHNGKTHPTGVLKNLKNYKKDGISYKEYEYKWIVIDRDKEYKGGGHTAKDFNEAITSSESKRQDLHINVAYSNDCFEFWYLLHLEYRDTPIMRDEIIEKLIQKLKVLEPHIFLKLNKDNIKNEVYTKHIFNVLVENQEEAIKRAQKLLDSYGDTHRPENDNPSTNVHKLIVLLNDLKN